MRNRDLKVKIADLIKQDKYPDALLECANLFRIDPKDEENLQVINFLFTRIQDGNYDFTPETSEHFLMRGTARFFKGEIQNCFEDINQALKLDPKNDQALNCRAYLHWQTKQYQKAINDYLAAIGIDPRGEYYGDLANMNREINKIPECLYFHHKAVELSPENPKLWYEFGIDLAETGHSLQEALRMFDKAIDLWPEFEDAIVNREQLLKFLEDNKK